MTTSALDRPAPDPRPPRRARPGTFFRVFLLWLLASWGVLGALLAPVLPGGWWTILALMAVVFAPLVLFLTRRRRGGSYPGAAFRLFVMRPFWYAQLALPLLAAAGALGALGGVPFGAAGSAGRAAVGVAAVLLAGVVAAGWVGSRRLVVTRLTATSPELPPGLDGLTVAQLSDLHVGPHTSRRHLARVVRAVADARPDLIAVTGDLVDDHAPDVTPYAESLGGLRAPLGVYVIPGNHDVYAGWPEVRERLERALPVTVLVNRAAVVERDGARLAVVGTGDPAGRGVPSSGAAPDVDAALAGVPRGAWTLALAHNPALWPALAERGVPLTLSGHTHWGQLALPGRGWNLAGQFLEHSMGAYARGRSALYIHPGTGFWGIPFRLGARPEVAVITLRRGDTVAVRASRG